MKKKKVSIIVPVYNTERYVDICLKSLVNQTLSDIEIIVINDGSTDNSEEIIKKYLEEYPDLIRYIKTENFGVSNARNIGIEAASGEYIGFCDADDYVEHDMFELLYKKAKETKAEIVSSPFYAENDSGSVSNRLLDNVSDFSKSLEENPNLLIVDNEFVTMKIFSKKMLDKNNIRFKRYRIFEDLLFNYSAMLKANKIEKVNKPLYHYIRRKDQSVTGTFNTKFYDLYPVMKELKKFYQENSNVDYNEYLTFIGVHHAYIRFYSKVEISKIVLKHKYVKDTYRFFDEYDPNWKHNKFVFSNRKYRPAAYWDFYPYLNKIKDWLRNKKRKLTITPGYRFIKYSKHSLLQKSILFDSQIGRDINGNMFYLIKELRNNSKYDDYKIYITVRKERIAEAKKKLKFYNIKKYKLLVINSKKYVKHLARNKYIFTDMSLPIYYKKRDGQVYVNTWHGIPLKYLGKRDKYEYYCLSNLIKNFSLADYLLCPNNYMKDLMIDSYMLDIRKNKILMLGYPRNNIFFEKGKINKTQKIAYLPTYRGNSWKIGGANYINDLTNILEEIDKSLKSNQEFYVNLHPFIKDKIDINKFKNIKPIPHKYETYDFLNNCDILVTDYSSVTFDFANTKKKIILFTYDKEDYLKDRGMYLDMESLPFPEVDNVEKLMNEINNKTIESYNDFLEKYCKYDSKYTSKQLLSLVLDNKNSKLKILENKRKIKAVLLESNNFNQIVCCNELKKMFTEYNKNKSIYLGFCNGGIKRNKTFLTQISDNIKYFGYYGNFELLSPYEKLLFKFLKKKRRIYKIFKHRFDKIFKDELDRRYQSVDFTDLILYKENDIFKIYLYSYINAKKILVLHKIPNVNLEIIDKYDKIIVFKEKDKEYLDRYIDTKKVFLIEKFNLNDSL